jgi:hypothetical protein
MNSAHVPNFNAEVSIYECTNRYSLMVSAANQNYSLKSMVLPSVGVFDDSPFSPKITCCKRDPCTQLISCSSVRERPGEVCTCSGGIPVCVPLVFE